MSLDEKNRKDLIQYNIEKANKTLDEVRFLIDNKYYSLALTRVYYGMYYILSALALKNQFTTSNHSQLIGWFNKNFVKDKKIDRKIGKMIYVAFEQRMKSDYDVLNKFDIEDANVGLDNLILVVEAISEIIEG